MLSLLFRRIRKKRMHRPRRPIRLRDIKMLLHVTRRARKQLKSYCTSFQSATDSDEGDQADDDDDDDDDEQSDTEEEEPEPIIEDVFGSFKRSNSVDPWSVVFGEEEQDHSEKRGFNFKDIVTMATAEIRGDLNSKSYEEVDGDIQDVSDKDVVNMPNGSIISKDKNGELNQNQSNSCDVELKRHPVKRGLSVTFADTPDSIHMKQDNLDNTSASNGHSYPSESSNPTRVTLANTRAQSETWGQSFSSIGPEFSDCDSEDETYQAIETLVDNCLENSTFNSVDSKVVPLNQEESLQDGL